MLIQSSITRITKIANNKDLAMTGNLFILSRFRSVSLVRAVFADEDDYDHDDL